jgi:hypothetical protein
MTCIRIIREDKTEGVLREVYDKQSKNTGSVSNYHQFLSLRPEVIGAYGEMVKTFRGKLRLRRGSLAAVTAYCRMEGFC